MSDVGRLLSAAEQGDTQAASQLLPLVYEELRKLASRRLAREKPGQTLQTTALVHEAYVRLVDRDRPPRWNGRGHFFAAAAEAMRRILIDAARRKRGPKAGGRHRRTELDGVEPAAEARDLDLIELDAALQELERTQPRKAAVVKLRFFAGLTNDETADALRVSPATAENDWAYARAWLKRRLDGASGEAPAQQG